MSSCPDPNCVTCQLASAGGEGAYMTLTYVVRLPLNPSFDTSLDIRELVSDDDAIMFWAAEHGVSEVALTAGAEPGDW